MWRKLWGTDNKQNTKGWIDVVLYIHDILLLHKYNIYALYIIKYNVHIYHICVWTIINKEKEPINFRVKVAWKNVEEGYFRGATGRKRKEHMCYNYISFKIYIKVKIGDDFLSPNSIHEDERQAVRDSIIQFPLNNA